MRSIVSGFEAQEQRVDRTGRRSRSHNRAARNAAIVSATTASTDVPDSSRRHRRDRADCAGARLAAHSAARSLPARRRRGRPARRRRRVLANSTAIARPIPRLAPVMSATLAGRTSCSCSGGRLSIATRSFSHADAIAERPATAGAFGMRFISGPSTPLAPNSTTRSRSYDEKPLGGIVPAHLVDDRANEIALNRRNVAIGLRRRRWRSRRTAAC